MRFKVYLCTHLCGYNPHVSLSRRRRSERLTQKSRMIWKNPSLVLGKRRFPSFSCSWSRSNICVWVIYNYVWHEGDRQRKWKKRMTLNEKNSSEREWSTDRDRQTHTLKVRYTHPLLLLLLLAMILSLVNQSYQSTQHDMTVWFVVARSTGC